MPDAVWIYGVEDGAAAGPPPGRGVDPAHPVELVRHAGLAALTSRVNVEEFSAEALRQSLEDLDKLEALARAHERVLDDALNGGAIVPFRICTIYSSEDRVREMLEREREPLAQALGRLRGKSEWGVKAYAPEAPATPAPATAPASGAEYLARKRAQRAQVETSRQTLEATIGAIHERLAAGTAGAVLSPPQDRRLTGRAGEMVLNAAYLVADDAVPAFRDLIAELEGSYGVALEITGPWPAYHFSR
jgi:hypothetical protein